MLLLLMMVDKSSGIILRVDGRIGRADVALISANLSLCACGLREISMLLRAKRAVPG